MAKAYHVPLLYHNAGSGKLSLMAVRTGDEVLFGGRGGGDLHHGRRRGGEVLFAVLAGRFVDHDGGLVSAVRFARLL